MKKELTNTRLSSFSSFFSAFSFTSSKLAVLMALFLLSFAMCSFSAFAAGDTITESFTTPEGQDVEVFYSTSPVLGMFEDFTAYSLRASFDVCQCDAFSGKIYFRNTGTLTTSYYTQKAGSAAPFVNYQPNYFSLDPGQMQNIEMVGDISCSAKEGIYNLETHFSTVSGDKKILTQQVNIIECDAFSAKAVYPSYKNYPCTPTVYELKIKNKKDFPETFKLSSDLGKGQSSFSEPYVLLAPGEEKSVYFIASLPCSSSGSYKFNVFIYSTTTMQKKTLPLYLTIDKAGYQFSMKLGEQVKLNKGNETPYIFKQAISPSLALCKDETYLIPVQLNNDAEFANTYMISSDAGTLLVPKKVSVPAKGSLILENMFGSKNVRAGNYTYSINAESEKGHLVSELKLNIEILDCKAQDKAQDTGLSTVEKSKIGKILLLILLLLLVVVLLFLLLMWNHGRKKSLYDELDEEDDKEKEMRENEAKVKAEEQAEKHKEEHADAKKLIDTFEDREHKPFNWWKPIVAIILILLLLLLILYGVYKWQTRDADQPQAPSEEENASITKNATLPVTKTAQETKADETKKETGEKAKGAEEKVKVDATQEKEAVPETEDQEPSMPSVWSRIWTWLTTSYKPSSVEGQEQVQEPAEKEAAKLVNETITAPQAVNKTAANETIIAPDINPDLNITVAPETQVEQPVVYVDPRQNMTQKEIDMLFLYIDEDESKAINLSGYFTDIDGDKLVYSSAQAQNVDIEYDGEIAYIIPHRDWSGESSVVFFAEDGKGGKAETPEIAVVVRPVDKYVTLAKEYRWYLVALGAAVLLIILLLIGYAVYKAKHPKQILLRKKQAKQKLG